MFHQPKVELKEIIKKLRERKRERIIIFSRETVRDNNKIYRKLDKKKKS